MTYLRKLKRIRVLSYNIHHGEGMDHRIDLARTADVIRSASPDLVALQEVDRWMNRTAYADQARDLAQLAGMHYAFGVAMHFDEMGQYGNAILSRWPIAHAQTHPLPGALEPRSILCVDIDLPTAQDTSQSLSLWATHLALDEASRLESVPQIASLVDDSARPALLAGDLNDRPASQVVAALDRMWHNATDGQDLVTFFANPAQIDYILYRPESRWHVVEVQALQEHIASDHCPILVELDLLVPTGD